MNRQRNLYILSKKSQPSLYYRLFLRGNIYAFIKKKGVGGGVIVISKYFEKKV